MIPPAEVTNEIPFEGIRIVQLGTKADVNFVNALSFFFPVLIDPVSTSDGSDEFQDLTAFDAELRTTDVMAPALFIFSKTPSRIPAFFLPPSVSELLPKTLALPSLLRITALS
ncbi:unannotated protein [freshwater metagenome]|uniref:Unannotated protein n=1 Tax=freshwater metagenome TaxID=449393 RepID=A0A6J7BB87_9ZZZZ